MPGGKGGKLPFGWELNVVAKFSPAAPQARRGLGVFVLTACDALIACHACLCVANGIHQHVTMRKVEVVCKRSFPLTGSIMNLPLADITH
jgi:hypothetical protein